MDSKKEKERKVKTSTKKFFTEFKDFAVKGNAINLAVGVIIGAAFQGIVNSLVQDVISPFIGIFAGTNFDSLVFTINGSEIKYGSFITAVINFLIMAFVIFIIVKLLNKLGSATINKNKEESAPTTKECPFCCSKIAIKATRCPECTSMLTKE